MADEKPPKKRRATYDDLVAVPGFLVAEILGGELVTSPRPRGPHARAETVLSRLLGGPFDDGVGGPGGWWILIEPELHLLDGEVAVPDIAGWRRARMPAIPDTHVFEIRPDWLCEVLSPATAARDRADKLALYADAGIPHVWLVDPAIRTLEVLRLDTGAWRIVAVHRGDAPVRAEPFDAVAIDLGLVWKTRDESVAAEEPPVSAPRR